MINAHISEIFGSVQGEGLLAGEPFIFVRFAGCPWRCDYCDEPGSLIINGHRRLSVEEVLDEVHHLQEEREHRYISLTGGEPLSQWSFIFVLAPLLQKLGFQTYLETSGTFPEALEKVVKYFDVVSLDIKAPSAIGREFWKEHERCLELSREKCFVKMVVTQKTPLDEIEKASRLVASVNRKIPFVLQPATVSNGTRPPSEDFQRKAQALAREFLDEVCIQPQMHPIWSVK